ncbi:MAG: GTP-binding protein Era [Chitinophagaceae bacterium]|nr:GTP-binding protein Era [Chitinophagaceae bacterium]
MKTGFVNIFGKPNAGKSTLLNALIGEKLAIVSPKVQTTRHRIKGFLTTEAYQVIFSDTPGIIEPRYKLHEKMMKAVKSALEDADVALLIYDLRDKDLNGVDELFQSMKLKVPVIVVCNKTDAVDPATIENVKQFFSGRSYVKEVVFISAKQKKNIKGLLDSILKYLPEGEPFYNADDMTDLPTRFFVGEIVREKIFELFEEEIPYHTAVIVQEFKEKSTLIKIRAEIIVNRETQKSIILGEKGSMIKKLGTLSRMDIEKFLQSKVFLELFVKVKPKWRDNEFQLREYGYN